MLLNRVPRPWFTCNRGPRQGDPLSPHLFLIIADILQSMIKQNNFVGHPISEDHPCPVLQYVDDTLILSCADLGDIKTLKKILHACSDTIGLKINFSKSTTVLMNIEEQQLSPMIVILGYRLEGFPQTSWDCHCPHTNLASQHSAL
jgi:hypothetical protein